MVQVELIYEEELSSEDRQTLGELIAAAFGDDDPREQAYWGQTQPALRLLAREDRVIVAQQSIFEMQSRPVRRVFGLGDLVVRTDHRGQGLARDLVERAVDICRARGAEVILTRTVALRSVFARLGFQPAEIEAAKGGDWMAWSDGKLPHLTALAPDDI